MYESNDRGDIHTAELPPIPRRATVYPIDALVRENNPSERAQSDAADLVRLVAELGPDAGIRVAFRKVAGEGRIEGHVALFGSATTEVTRNDLRFVFSNTLVLGAPLAAEASGLLSPECSLPVFTSAYELSRVAIASTEFEPDPAPLELRADPSDRFLPPTRPTYAAPTADGWDSTAFVLKLMAQAEDEIWTWTDLAPASALEQQMVVDELNTIYTYAGIGHHAGTVVRARTVIAGIGPVSPMVRSGLSRRSRELRLGLLDPSAATRLWADPVVELAGHAASQTHAEALTSIPGVWTLNGLGMATRERPVPDRILDPIPPAPTVPIRLGWATDTFTRRIDAVEDITDLLRHTFIEGRSGGGKTTLLAQLFWSITRAGYQAIWLDPHGDGVQRAAAYSSSLDGTTTYYIRHGDREHPVRINMFAEKDAESRERMLAELLELIQVMLDPNQEGMVGERFKRSVSLVAQAAFELFGSHTSITDVLALTLTKQALRELRDAIRHRALDLAIRLDAELIQLGDKEFAELISWLVSRLQPFLRTPALRDILGTGEDSVDLLEVIDSGRNLLIDLASLDLGEDVARVLGALWLLKLRNAIARRKDRTRPVVLLVDEAHLYRFGALPSLLAEARKFGIGIVIATQAADNLTPRLARAIEANCGSSIALRIGVNAAAAAAERLGGWPARQLTRLADLTAAAALSRNGIPTPAFTLHIDHFTVIETEGWTTETIEHQAKVVFDASMKVLWEPYRDLHVLEDSNVISLVRTAGARTRPAPAATERPDDRMPVHSNTMHEVCDVILDACGNRPIQVIKTIREATGLGLSATKSLTDTPGSTIIRGVPHQRAKEIQRGLIALGADVRVIASSAHPVEGDQ